MTDNDALANNILTLRHTLARAIADAITAARDLEQGNPRAAVGALVPIDRALQDARSLLDAIFILNRQLN